MRSNMNALHIILYLFVAIASVVFLLIRKYLHYWADRGIVYEKPALFYGNMREVGRTQSLRQPFRDFYAKYKNVAPFGGFYFSMRLAVVILDLELVKNVLIKDFANFSDRGAYHNERDDPISAHLFNVDGAKWRSLRSKLTPTFTSGKMRYMFPTMVEVAERFVHVLEELMAENERKHAEPEEFSIEMRDVLARFTTDVIGSCAFGLECNSLKDPNTEFRRMGKKIFAQRRHNRFAFALINAFPNVARKLRIKNTPDDVSDFFMRVVRDTVEYREREHVQRNDFMNLLLELKNRNDIDSLTLEQIAAQSFVFFLAGFETSSSTMGFCLYELALNQDIQEKARTEINDMLQRHEGQFSYEGMRELKYLQQILHETMRIYSIASFTLRQTLNDYKVPNSKYVIPKNTLVVVPVDAIHVDPDIYPEPEKFDPSRFSAEQVEKRHSMSWLPFGEGPRNCIGLRFGEMQAIVGLVMLLKHFRFSPAKQTEIPLKIKLNSFILASENGITLKLEKL